MTTPSGIIISRDAPQLAVHERGRARTPAPGSATPPGPSSARRARPTTYISSRYSAPPLRIALAQREEHQRQRHERRDPDVDEDAAREHHQPRRGGEADRRPEPADADRRSPIVRDPRSVARDRDPPRARRRSADDHQRAERDAEALRRATETPNSLVEAGDDPVAQDRLVEARLVVERRVDEVAAPRASRAASRRRTPRSRPRSPSCRATTK